MDDQSFGCMMALAIITIFCLTCGFGIYFWGFGGFFIGIAGGIIVCVLVLGIMWVGEKLNLF